MRRRNLIASVVIALAVSISVWASQTQEAARDDVRGFGAVGEGEADDTSAIQKAVDSGIGVVQLSKGVYRITRPVVIDLDKVGYTSTSGGGVAGIVMAGPGPALKFVGAHFKSADREGFSEDVWRRQRMTLVDGVAIEDDHAEAIAIEAVGTMQLTLARVHVRSALHGIRLVGNNRNVIVSDCHIYHNRGLVQFTGGGGIPGRHIGSRIAY